MAIAHEEYWSANDADRAITLISCAIMPLYLNIYVMGIASRAGDDYA